MVLYEALAGQHPFPGLTPVERLFKHLNEPLPLLQDLDRKVTDAINGVIQKATAKNPLHRYANALELAAAFREAASISPTAVGEDIVSRLTWREQEILQLLIEGNANSEIAQKLVVTVTTVRWYLRQIYRKLGVRSRVQAIVRARQLDLVVGGVGRETIPVAGSGISLLLPEPENPYKGLRAFQPADAADFFGREALTQKLLGRMREKGDATRFLAVVGPSGSGKSSLVKAGLIPALWRGELPGSEKWFVVDVLPGARPLDELEVALTRVAADPGFNLGEHLRRDEAGLLRVAGLILPDDGSELVVVIDQFEEVFTLVGNEDQRTRFLDLLGAAVTDPRSRVRVIVTLRADFYDRPLQYQGIAELVQARSETVLPLRSEELERAIVKPAERVGVHFEEGLVASIVGEVHYQPGALPLLQYALTELFERRDGRLLTDAAYEQIGRSTGALGRRAEEIYAEMDTAGQESARQMFLRLVTQGDGMEDTRRRVDRAELLAVVGNPEVMDEVIDTYAGYRLLSLDNDPTTRQPIVEVAHEAILREWDRLRTWLNESRADIRLQRQLAVAAKDWNSARQDRSFLLRGARLEQFEGWSKASGLTLTQGERDYLDASLKLRDEEVAAESVRQAREAGLERRAARVLRVLVGVFAAAAVVSGGLAVWANQQAQEARRQASIGLGAQALLELEGWFPERAASLALEALENYPYTWQAERALGEAVTNNRLQLIPEGHKDWVTATAWSSDGSRFLTAGGGDGSAIVWDGTTGQRVLRLWHTSEVYDAAWSPSEDRVLTATADGTAKIWDSATGRELFTLSGHELFTLSGHEEPIGAAAWSPQGDRVATASLDGTAKVWDAYGGKELLTLASESEVSALSSVAWSPSGKQVAIAAYDGNASVWDAATGVQLFTLDGHEGYIFEVSFSPQGSQILTASSDHTARVWDASTGEALYILATPDSVSQARWSASGDRILTTSGDGVARIWNAADGELIFAYDRAERRHRFDSFDAAWSPDGQTIAVPHSDGRVTVVDAATGDEVMALAGHSDLVVAVRWSPDGTRLLTVDTSGDLRVWDVSPRAQILSGHEGLVSRIAWSADGRRIASASEDGTARIWGAATGEQLLVMERPWAYMREVMWSPAGDRIATVSTVEGGDTDIQVWDATTGKGLYAIDEDEDTDWDWIVASWSPAGDRFVLAGIGFASFLISPTGTQPVNFYGALVHVLDGATGDVLLSFRRQEYEGGRAVDWSPDGEQVVSGSHQEGDALVWDPDTGETRLTLGVENPGEMTVARWSPDGTRIATYSLDAVGGRIWDAATGDLLLTFAGPEVYANQSVNEVDWSPSGDRLMTSVRDGETRIWDAHNGYELLSLSIPGGGHGAWSPDGKRLALSSGDQIYIVDVKWDTPEELIAYAKQCCIIRELTANERELFGLPPLAERTTERDAASKSIGLYAAAIGFFGLAGVVLAVLRRR